MVCGPHKEDIFLPPMQFYSKCHANLQATRVKQHLPAATEGIKKCSRHYDNMNIINSTKVKFTLYYTSVIAIKLSKQGKPML